MINAAETSKRRQGILKRISGGIKQEMRASYKAEDIDDWIHQRKIEWRTTEIGEKLQDTNQLLAGQA